jgi:hypothetical protein
MRCPSVARSVVGMRHHPHITTIRSLAVAGVMCAVLAGQAAAVPAIDARSPDAQDAGQPVAFDLRSPDAADPVRTPVVVPVVKPHISGTSENGFDLTSALIGAGGALLLGAGGVGLARTRGHVAPLGS